MPTFTPIYNNGLTAWSSTYKSFLKQVTTLQNKVIKTVGGGNYRDKVTPFCLKLGTLILKDLALFEKALFVFKLKMKLLLHFDNYVREVGQVFIKNTKTTLRDNYFIALLKISKARSISRIYYLEIFGYNYQKM